MGENKNETQEYVRAFITFETEDSDELRRYLDHHMEYLIDFDDMGEVCRSACGVMSYVDGDDDNTEKIKILRSVVKDILAGKQSDGGNNAEVLDELRKLEQVLGKAGY